MDKHDLFGLPLSHARTLDEILQFADEALDHQRPASITFVNPHAWTLTRQQNDYLQLLHQFDLILADGIAVVAAAQHIRQFDIQRFSFDATSLYDPIFKRLASGKHRLFVIGAAPGVAERALQRMRHSYPDIDYCGSRDGFGSADANIADIMAAEPDMVLCGMGAPYQERLLIALRTAGFSGLAFTCGGFLDQLAAREQYYPGWIDEYNLRWAWRFWCEPSRLWRRYLIDYAPFFRLAAHALLTQRPERPNTEAATG